MNTKLPIYKLAIGENEDEDVDFIALVESPAIQRNFLAFNQQFVQPNQGETKEDFMPRCISYVINEGKENEQAVAICSSLWEQKFADSFNDYPQSAKDNAARGIRLNDELGNKCATQVGKVRAQQIMGGENLSKETIKRTYSYLSRASAYYNPEDTEACGTISYLLWGGEPMLRWCESKMNKEDFSAGLSFAIQNEEQRIVSGPLMIADLPIYRNDEQGEYYVVFTAPEIKRIVQRFFKNGYQSNVNVEHATKVDGVYMFESFIIEREKGINPPKGYEDLPDGSWWGSFKVDNPKIWEEVKDGTFNGFSIEGMFKYELIPDKDQQTMNKIIEILEQIEH